MLFEKFVLPPPVVFFIEDLKSRGTLILEMVKQAAAIKQAVARTTLIYLKFP